ncbi:MAG: hypothetical protein AAF703_12935 [Cyanobacteria bacterium P01_D01_bin.105]
MANLRVNYEQFIRQIGHQTDALSTEFLDRNGSVEVQFSAAFYSGAVLCLSVCSFVPTLLIAFQD